LESISDEGEHRLVVLRCGHGYGRVCYLAVMLNNTTCPICALETHGDFVQVFGLGLNNANNLIQNLFDQYAALNGLLNAIEAGDPGQLVPLIAGTLRQALQTLADSVRAVPGLNALQTISDALQNLTIAMRTLVQLNAPAPPVGQI
jgi:hypothetical protein